MGELLRKTVGRIIEAEAKKEDSELQMYSQEPSGAMGEMEPGDVPVDELPPEEEPAGDAERVAQEFHETYERLAPEHGYDTRDASKGTWDEVPEENRNLMTAVVGDLIERGVIATGEGEVEPEVPPEEPPLPETDDGDPWVPLDAVEGFCGECAREMMSRNIKAVRLSVLTEAGLVEQEGPVPSRGEMANTIIRAEKSGVGKTTGEDEALDAVMRASWGPEAYWEMRVEGPYDHNAGKPETWKGEYLYLMDEIGEEELRKVYEAAKRLLGQRESVTEKKADKDGWSKKLKAGRFTEWCMRNGFKGGPNIASVKKVMESGDEDVRGCAKFFADTIKPEGKDLSDIMGKEKK